MINPASCPLTRVTEVIPHRSHARDISPICCQLSGPCSPSSQTPSRPNCPRKSIISLSVWPETTVTALPSRSFCFAGFVRMNGLPLKNRAWRIASTGARHCNRIGPAPPGNGPGTGPTGIDRTLHVWTFTKHWSRIPGALEFEKAGGTPSGDHRIPHSYCRFASRCRAKNRAEKSRALARIEDD